MNNSPFDIKESLTVEVTSDDDQYSTIANIFYKGIDTAVLVAWNKEQGVIEDFNEYKEEFLSFFGELFSLFPIDQLEPLFPLVNMPDYWEESFSFIDFLEATDREKLLVLIACCADDNVKEIYKPRGEMNFLEKVLELVRDRVKMFELQHSSVDDVIGLIDPVFSQNGVELNLFMRSFVRDEEDFELFKDKEYRDFFQHIYSAMESRNGFSDEDKKLSSIPVRDLKDFSGKNLNRITMTKGLPIRYKEFRELAQGLTITQLRKCTENIPLDASLEVSMEIAKSLTQTLNKDTTIRLCHQINHVAFLKLVNVSNATEIKRMHDMFIGCSSHYQEVLETLLVFFSETTRRFEDTKEITDLVDMVFKNSYENSRSWLADSSYRSYLIIQLSKKFGGYEAIEKILEVYETDAKLNFAQWMNYIDNYDDYSDAPTSWWVNLV